MPGDPPVCSSFGGQRVGRRRKGSCKLQSVIGPTFSSLVSTLSSLHPFFVHRAQSGQKCLIESYIYEHLVWFRHSSTNARQAPICYWLHIQFSASFFTLRAPSGPHLSIESHTYEHLVCFRHSSTIGKASSNMLFNLALSSLHPFFCPQSTTRPLIHS